MDFLLDANGDLSVPDTGVLRLTSGAQEIISQRLRIKLRTFLGEWFLDQRVGVAYYRDVLVKNPNLEIIRSIFRDAILSDEGVDSVPRLDLELGSDRTLSISFDAYIIGESTVVTRETAPIIITVGTQSDPFILFF